MAIFNMEDSSINDYYLNEDISDMKSYYAHRLVDEKGRSRDGVPKRPKISKDMSKFGKEILHSYDHGNPRYNTPDIISKRHSLSLRNREAQTAEDYHRANARNKVDEKLYTDSYKRKKKLREAAEYILSVLDEMDYIEESHLYD